MNRDSFHVTAEWDADAGVWYVSDSDVPGLAAEAETTEALLAKLRILVPDLVALNRHLLGDGFSGGDLPVYLTTHRTEHMRAAE